MKTLARWLYQTILPLGAPGLFLIALLDSGLIPVPQGVDVLLFAQVVHHPSGFVLYALLATLGSLLGCIFLYYISKKAGEAALVRRTSQARIDGIRKQFEKYEALTLVLPTMIPLPLPMKVFVIAAGVFEVRFRLFVLAIVFARAVRYFSIALVAYRYGDQAWAFMRHNTPLAACVAAVLIGLFYWISRRFR